MGRRLLLCTLTVALWVDTVKPLLDPGRITGWRAKWAPAEVVLSCNNAQATDVQATFYFSPTNTVVDGLLEIAFPVGFSVANAVGGIVQVPGSFFSKSDCQVSVSGVTNPFQCGLYGPFSIRTRLSPSGQQIDANLLFASVYIETPIRVLSSFLVLFSGANINNVVSRSGNTLAFKMQLAVSLWRYDTFVIEISKHWTVGSSPVCISAQVPGKTNNYNGTNNGNSHLLDCVVTPKVPNESQKVYIYGLAVDGLDFSELPDSTSVNLQVTPITTPSVAYFSSMFQWTVSTVRFGTTTVLESGSYTNGPVIAPDSIMDAEWTPTWGLNKSDLQSAMHIYMDMRFTLPSAVSSGGSVVIVLSEDVCSLFWGEGTDFVDLPQITCYIIDFLGEKTTCSTSSKSTISITNLPALRTNSSIRIRNLVKIVSLQGTKAQILSINSYDDSGINIDSGSNLAAFTVSSGSPSVYASDFVVSFQDKSNAQLRNAGGSGNINQIIAFVITPDKVNSQFVASSTVRVTCPISFSQSDFAIFIPRSGYTVEWVLDTKDFKTATIFQASGLSDGSSPVITEGGSITFAAGSSMIPLNYFLFSISVSAGPPFLAPPLVASNAATAYECYLRIEDTANANRKTPQVQVAQFKVSPQNWSVLFSMICSNNIAGAPGMLQFSPSVVGLQASTTEKNYQVEILFGVGIATGMTASGFACGLTSGEAYPFDCNGCANAKAKLVFTQMRNYVRFEGIGKVAAGSPSISLFFPVSGVVIGKGLKVTVRSLYFLTSDSRVRYVTHEQQSASYETTSTASSVKFASVLASGTQVFTGELAPDLKINLIQSPPTGPFQWIYIILPKGCTWTSNRAVRVDSPTVVSQMYFFSATSDLFMYPGVLFSTASPSSNLAITLSGFRMPKGKPWMPQTVTVVTGKSGGVSNACLHTSFTDIPMTVESGAITGENIVPRAIFSRGPDGVDISHTVAIKLSHGLDANGFIIITIGNEWATTPCTSCSVSDLQPATLGQAITCSYTGNVITITGFADFNQTLNKVVAVEIEHLLTPELSSPPSSFSSDFISSIISRTSVASGFLIVDTYKPGTNTEVAVTPSSDTGRPVWKTKRMLPDAGGVDNVSVYLQFVLPHRVPACGTIRIAGEGQIWRLPTGDIKNFCYFAPVAYRSCILSGLEILLTLAVASPAGTTFELLIERAVQTQPASDPEQKAIIVSSYWFTQLIDADGTALSTQQSSAPSHRPEPVPISAISLMVDPLTVGELANYNFTFKDTMVFGKDHQYWFTFPQEYDYFLGEVTQTFSLESIYYLPCVSPQLQTLTCRVSHSQVILTGVSADRAFESLSVVLSSVRNPFVTRSSYIQVVHVNALNECISAQQRFANVDFQSQVAKIDLRSIEATSVNRGSISDFLIRAYISDTVKPSSVLKLTFPPEFTLADSSYVCESFIFDTAKPVNSRYKEVWSPTTDCRAEGNNVIVPTGDTVKTFTAQQLVYVRVYNVTNPGSGWSRVALDTDFDVWDEDIWPAREFWSQKFSLSLRSSPSAVSSRSYANLHSVYMGFSSLLRSLFIQADSPLVLIAGTQSADLNLTTVGSQQPCQAKSLLLTPAVSPLTPDAGGLLFTSNADNFTIVHSWQLARFRIAARSDVPKGIYKVVWTVQETVQNGVSEPQYTAPEPILVAVYPPDTFRIPIEVAEVPQLTPGFRSPPIRVYMSNSPHSDVTVNVHLLGAPRNVSVQPNALKFGPDDNECYFHVTVSGRYRSKYPLSTQTLVFNISGTDRLSFTITPTVNFTILEGISASPGQILSLGLSNPAKTSITSQPSVSLPGVLYWFLAPLGTVFPSFSDLKRSIPPLSLHGNRPSYYTDAAAIERNQTEPQYRESWVSFQRRLYRVHMNSSWSGSISVTNVSNPPRLDLTWLWAETTYSLLMYLEPMGIGEKNVSSRSELFITAICPPSQSFRVKFQGYLISAFTSKIANLAAK